MLLQLSWLLWVANTMMVIGMPFDKGAINEDAITGGIMRLKSYCWGNYGKTWNANRVGANADW